MSITFRGGALRLRASGGINVRGDSVGGDGNGVDPNTPLPNFVVTNPSATTALPVGTVISFGHAIADGDLDPTTHHVTIDGADGTTVPTQQYDQDGTTRYGKLRFIAGAFALPLAIAAGGSKQYRLNRTTGVKSQAASSATLPTGLTAELDIGGVTWVASFADAQTNSLGFKIGASRTIKNGPVTKAVRCAARFVSAGVGHDRLWARWYVYARYDGTFKVAVKILNGMIETANSSLAIANYTVTACRLVQSGTTLLTMVGWDAHYHGAWDIADGDGEPYQSGGVVKYGIGFDMDYLAKAYACGPYMPGLGTHIKTSAQSKYSMMKPVGYTSIYVPGDPGGYNPQIGATSDDAYRQELGIFLAGWSFANLATGTYDWKRYDVTQSIMYQDMPKNYHDTNGEVPALFGTAGTTPYSGLGTAKPGLGFGGGSTGGANTVIVNPAANPPSYSNSGGWFGTDLGTAGGSPNLTPDHWSHAHVGSYLSTGDYTHLDAMIADAVHCVGIVNPAFRNKVIDGVTVQGSVWYGIQERAVWRGSATALSNAVYYADDAHPAKICCRDMLDNLWAIWPHIYNSQDAASHTLNWVVREQNYGSQLGDTPSSNGLRATPGSGWRPHIAACAVGIYKLREKTTDPDFFIEHYIRRHAQGMMGGGNIAGSTAAPGGCMDRAFAYHYVFAEQDGGGVWQWMTQWSHVKFTVTNGATVLHDYLYLGTCTGVPENGSAADFTGLTGGELWQPYFNGKVFGYWADARCGLIISKMVDDIYGILPESATLLTQLNASGRDVYTPDVWATSPKYAFQLPA